jgi:hypothetical protein
MSYDDLGKWLTKKYKNMAAKGKENKRIHVCMCVCIMYACIYVRIS